MKLDGIGLSALAIGSILVYAGIKGYSVLAVVENVIVGRPIHTGVRMAHRLTVNAPGDFAAGATAGITAVPSGRNRGPN